MHDIFSTKQFQEDLDNLDNSIKRRVATTIRKIEQNPYQKGTHAETRIRNRKIMRSRVTDNFRILWEWADKGDIHLWRVGSHKMIDAIDSIRTKPKELTRYFTRDEEDHSAVEIAGLHGDAAQPQPFKHVPDNILRLYGVPDEALAAVKALTDAETVWDLPIPENVQMTLYDILSNPDWTLEDLLDTRQLLFRTTVDQLEGYCEGKIKQLLLNLNEEQESYVHISATGPVLIKGVAGSGKTTIGLYRAHHLAKEIEKQRRMFGEETRILLLTYTETLTNALRQLYTELYGDLPYSLTVADFKGWMKDQIFDNGVKLAEASKNIRQQIMRQAQQEIAQQTGNTKVRSGNLCDYFLSEIDDVIRARMIYSFEQYRDIERTGRGIRLSRDRQRPIVWQIYKLYQEKLDEHKLFDWADLARLTQKHCPQLPQYDVVIIDEAQDFPPSDLNLATRLVPNYKELRSLTLLADPAQSIYYRGIPWKESGINIQGRTRVLAKNYRNTKQILEAARPVVEGLEDVKAEEEYIPPSSTERPGKKPVILSYRNYADGFHYVADEIVRLCQQGKYRPGDIAVLGRFKKSFNLLTGMLNKADLEYRHFRSQDFQILENYIKLVTMHSAKGLEFPVVFIIGLDNDYFPFIRRNSRTRTEDALAERKLFYVSMTRAAEQLYLICPQNNPSVYVRDLDEASVTRKNC